MKYFVVIWRNRVCIAIHEFSRDHAQEALILLDEIYEASLADRFVVRAALFSLRERSELEVTPGFRVGEVLEDGT